MQVIRIKYPISVQDGSSTKKEGDLLELPNDPLNWFGLLTPTSLQQAQTKFKSAIGRAVELCNLKYELEKSLTEFEKISALTADVKDISVNEN